MLHIESVNTIDPMTVDDIIQKLPAPSLLSPFPRDGVYSPESESLLHRVLRKIQEEHPARRGQTINHLM